jgi:hypothetical protein
VGHNDEVGHRQPLAYVLGVDAIDNIVVREVPPKAVLHLEGEENDGRKGSQKAPIHEWDVLFQLFVVERCERLAKREEGVLEEKKPQAAIQKVIEGV